MVDPILVLSVLKIITIALGALFLVRSWRAYQRHREGHLMVLTVAVGLLTLSAIVEGFVYQTTLDLDLSHIVEAAFTLVAFAVLVYSLYH